MRGTSSELGMLVRGLSFIVGKLMAHVGRTKCDRCGSKDGFACRNDKGHPMAQPHPIRLRKTINDMANYNEWIRSQG